MGSAAVFSCRLVKQTIWHWGRKGGMDALALRRGARWLALGGWLGWVRRARMGTLWIVLYSPLLQVLSQRRRAWWKLSALPHMRSGIQGA